MCHPTDGGTAATARRTFAREGEKGGRARKRRRRRRRRRRSYITHG
jgi:hypothetical protein